MRISLSHLWEKGSLHARASDSSQTWKRTNFPVVVLGLWRAKHWKGLPHFLDWSCTCSHVLHLKDEPRLTVDIYSFWVWEWSPPLVRFSILHPFSQILSTNPNQSVLPPLSSMIDEYLHSFLVLTSCLILFLCRNITSKPKTHLRFFESLEALWHP